MRKLLTIVALSASTALVSAGLALPASATTAACRSGPYVRYCFGIVDHESFPLALDSRGKSAANNTPIIGFPNLNGDAGSDFVVLAFQGGSSDMFIFAPNGKITNMCVANPAGGFAGNPGGPFGLILRPCNGSIFQRFNVVSVPGKISIFFLTSVADHRIIHSNGQGASLTAVPLPAAPTSAEMWSFAG